MTNKPAGERFGGLTYRAAAQTAGRCPAKPGQRGPLANPTSGTGQDYPRPIETGDVVSTCYILGKGEECENGHDHKFIIHIYHHST